MRSAIARALIFAGVTLAVTLAIDAVLSLLYQPAVPEGGLRRAIAFRTALHGATFTLTALGAALGFALPGAAAISRAHAALLGGGFGAFALAATLTGVRVGGFAVIALVLVAGAAAVAWFGARAIAMAAEDER
ncbi:MAG TPA: hypothetical protein VFP44_09025 [Usitatibacter sp.]|nr:hypothetical protein [Usitatibacter sp.]